MHSRVHAFRPYNTGIYKCTSDPFLSVFLRKNEHRNQLVKNVIFPLNASSNWSLNPRMMISKQALEGKVDITWSMLLLLQVEILGVVM